MLRFSIPLLTLLLLAVPGAAQTAPPATLPVPAPTAGAKPAPAATTPAAAPPSQTDLDRLTESNLELLQLLKKQQAVLEDIQYDRRLQSRLIQNLEERLQETLIHNTELESKVSALEAAAAAPARPTPTGASPGGNTNGAIPGQTSPPSSADNSPPVPDTYLPPPEPAGASGTSSWQRLFTLSGTDGRDTDLFQIKGRRWRVLWHNQDKPGKAYLNTSALFVHAYPKDDTIPQEVCSKLGSGGNSTELVGPGNYYLKVEASGGNWELAVEEFR